MQQVQSRFRIRWMHGKGVKNRPKVQVVVERSVGEGRGWCLSSRAGTGTWVTHSLIRFWKLWVLLLQSSFLAGIPHAPHELDTGVEQGLINYTLLIMYLYIVLCCTVP